MAYIFLALLLTFWCAFQFLCVGFGIDAFMEWRHFGLGGREGGTIDQNTQAKDWQKVLISQHVLGK